jgi:hypothetical protein
VPDIILAEYDGTCWMVLGVEHLDALLGNTLPPEVSLEFVPCTDISEVDALWRYHAGEEAEHSQPWAIHPNVVRRIKGLGQGTVVAFGPWSALLDAAAQQAIGRVAEMAKAKPEAILRLIGQADPATGPLAQSMLQLRHQMIEAALAAAGVDRARVQRVVWGPADQGYRPDQADKVDIQIAAD